MASVDGSLSFCITNCFERESSELWLVQFGDVNSGVCRQIKTGGASQAAQPIAQARPEVGGSIHTIMQCGNINESQLQFLEPVGAGAGGRVYR